MLLGDLNYPGINWCDHSSVSPKESYFLDFLSENSLCQHITEPTRGNNILDLCITPSAQNIREVSVHEPFSSSDHSYFTLNLIVGGNMTDNQDERLIFHRADWQSIRLHLSCVEWRDLLVGSVQNCWNKFKNLVRFLISTYVPKFCQFPRSIAPWSNNHIARITRIKKNKWRKYKRNVCERTKREYNQYCKYVKAEIVEAKSNYEKTKFISRNHAPRVFYSYVDNCTNSRNGIPNLQLGNRLITEDKEKTDALSNNFQSYFTVDNGIFPQCAQFTSCNSVSSIRISDLDVVNAFKKMNTSSAPGYDMISAKFLQQTKCFMVEPLKIIFQKSLESGLLPDDWKKSIIVPIYKNNSKPSELQSYRPISLTSTVCKLMERILYNFSYSYLRENSLISEVQHGFVAGKSTTSNLIEYLNYVTHCVDAKIPVDVLCIDFAKAFDSVSHAKLLYKLERIGFRGKLLAWFKNFLLNRYQSVRVNESMSSFIKVESGIPQGTILGPLFFIIYIDGLSKNIKNGMNLYADDSKLYGSVANAFDLSIFQRDLDTVTNFCNAWQLNINNSKCEVIHFGLNNPSQIYNVNGNVVPEKSSYKDLGVTISSDLSFSKHYDNICKVAYFRMKQIDLSFACKEVPFRLFMYLTYIRPILETSSQVWSPYLIQDIDKIEKVQRRFTKYLPGLRNMSYSSRLVYLEIDSLEKRRIINDLCFVYKLLNNFVDMDFNRFFTLNRRNTRGHRMKITVNYSRVNNRKYFFVNRIISIWNNLPANVVESSSISTFKSRLKEVELECYCRGRAHTADE